MIKIAWNDEFELLNENGTHVLSDFTGHVRFKGTDCDVEHACVEFVLNRPEYLDGVEPWTKQAKSLNYVNLRGGRVVSGDVCCKEVSGSVFDGGRLLCDSACGIVFNGMCLEAYSLEGSTVNSGDVTCQNASKCRICGGVFKCVSWDCGEMENGVFVGNWNEGYFKGGEFRGVWHGGTWIDGDWHGDSRVGNGTFDAITKNR